MRNLNKKIIKSIKRIESSIFNTEMKIDELNDSLHYRERRRRFKLNNKEMAGIIIISLEVAFKAFVIYSLL